MLQATSTWGEITQSLIRSPVWIASIMELSHAQGYATFSNIFTFVHLSFLFPVSGHNVSFGYLQLTTPQICMYFCNVWLVNDQQYYSLLLRADESMPLMLWWFLNFTLATIFKKIARYRTHRTQLPYSHATLTRCWFNSGQSSAECA